MERFLQKASFRPGFHVHLLLYLVIRQISARDDGPAQFSSRFSKSATERETMLQERKNSMLEQARRRYLTNQSASGSSNIDTRAMGSEIVASSETWQFTNDPNSSSNETQTSSSEYLRHCRELAFQAAQRRIHEQRNT